MTVVDCSKLKVLRNFTLLLLLSLTDEDGMVFDRPVVSGSLVDGEQVVDESSRKSRLTTQLLWRSGSG